MFLLDDTKCEKEDCFTKPPKNDGLEPVFLTVLQIRKLLYTAIPFSGFQPLGFLGVYATDSFNLLQIISDLSEGHLKRIPIFR